MCSYEPDVYHTQTRASGSGPHPHFFFLGASGTLEKSRWHKKESVLESVDFQKLNYAYLSLHVERIGSLLDRVLLTSFPPNSTQVEDVSRRLGSVGSVEDLDRRLVEITEKIGEARSASLGLHGRPFPLDILIREANLSRVAQEGFILALTAVLEPMIRHRLALLRDNILLGHVDVGLVLQLFEGDPIARLDGRRFFEPESALLRNRLVELTYPKDALTTDYLLAREIRIPSRVESFVLGREALDAQVAPYCRYQTPILPLDRVVLPEEQLEELLGLLDHLMEGGSSGSVAREDLVRVGRSLVLHVSGAPGTGKSLLVDAVAARLSRSVLTVECAKLAGADGSFGEILDRIFFESRQRQAILCFDGAEELLGEGNPRSSTLLRHFEQYEGIVVLASCKNLGLAIERWVAYHMKLQMPTPELRQKIWSLHLPEHMTLDEDVDIPGLAHPYELTGSQIRNGILLAMNRAMSRAGEPRLDQSLLMRSAQDQLRADVSDMADRSGVKVGFEQLILPDEQDAQVKEILDACRIRTFVLTHWGFGKRLSTGRGITLLFSGEPGTGKTLCAEILAAELDIPLFRVSVPRIMSKWVGETEKNLAEVFKKAKGSHSMLLFDEADSLFTSRVKVENSTDRFANMETNLLLQEIERFEGVIILTTNHEENIDEAFQRRIQFKVSFPFPDPSHRAQIWKALLPPECPVEDNLDFDLVGESYELSGGYIKNAMLRAAYRAAIDGSPVSMKHIEDAAEQECRNAGKIFRSISSAKIESLF